MTWWRRLTAPAVEPGPSEERMLAVLAIYGGWLMLGVTAVYTVLFLIVASSREHVPAGSTAVVAVIGGAFFVWGVCRVLGILPAGAWIVDALLAASAGTTVAVLGVPTASSWSLRTVAIAALGAQLVWARRRRAAWTVSLVAVGSLAITTASTVGAAESVAALPVLVQFALTAVAVLSIRLFTRRIDEVAARTERERREAEVVAATRAADRLELATLHDTACTTLLMVSGGAAESGADWLPTRARSDLDALLERPEPVTGTIDIATVVDEVIRGCAFPSSLQVNGPLELPATVASAVLDGMREAVQNINLHAKATRVKLLAGTAADGVWIELVDDGVGFRPADVPLRCRGISESIVGRMNAVGGTVAVDSDLGVGTTVRWTYP